MDNQPFSTNTPSNTLPLPSFIDTHIHIDNLLDRLAQPIEKLSDVIHSHFENWPPIQSKTKPWTLVETQANWEASIHVCCTHDGYAITRQLIEFDRIFATCGLHPEQADQYNDQIEQELLSLIQHPKVLAWGEIGLDYHLDFHQTKLIQQQVFSKQIGHALRLNKPLVIHTREAEEDTIRIMKELIPNNWPIHIHCFTSSLDMANQLMDYFSNLVFGFTGVVTFNNATLVRDTMKAIPIDRIILETDGPYLAPIPYRGHPATSGMIPIIANRIAKEKEITINEVYHYARENTKKIYRL